jgi:hypothetical protein
VENKGGVAASTSSFGVKSTRFFTFVLPMLSQLVK